MSKNGPNKTVAAARRRMGGFPKSPERPPSEFMAFVFKAASEGRVFKNEEEAMAAFARTGAAK